MSKKVVIGVCGGVAAYKSAELVRRLRDHGATVRVVMTEGAKQFITPLTMQAVSDAPVHETLFDPAAEAAMGHIELARWADCIVIAPATADILAKMAHGFADNLLTTLVLATESPVLVAPAMNRIMWSHVATQANMKILQERGVHCIGPDSGEQACGEVGLGRMSEPQAIADKVMQLG